MKRIALVLLAACGAAPPAAPPAKVVDVKPSTSSAPLPPPPPPSARPSQDLGRWRTAGTSLPLGEGRLGVVVAGRRVIVEGHRATLVDEQAVPDLGRAYRIPETLGGGWLFVGEHAVHGSPAFDGALRRLASDVDTAQLALGHDLVIVDAKGAKTAIERSTGSPAPLPVPDAVEIMGLPTGLVAARTRAGALHISAKKGEPFKLVTGATDVDALAYDGLALVVMTRKGQMHLAADGWLVPRPNVPGMTVAGNLQALMDPFPDMSKPPPARPDVEVLVEPLVASFSSDAALAARGADLAVLDGRTGAVKATHAGAFAGHENCFPIRGGQPSFFACNDPTGVMALMRVDAVDKKPTVERTFKGVYSQDFGEPPPDAPLALAKKCDGSDARGVACVRKDDKTWTELPALADPDKVLDHLPFVVHVAASSDGAVYAFGWYDGNADLVVLDWKAKAIRRVPKASLPAWAASGIRWSSVVIDKGTIRFVVPGARSPGILEILPDNSVKAEPLAGRVAAVHARLLLATPDGRLRESLDAGRTFQDVVLPPGGISEKGMFSCNSTGCTVGSWIRPGWGP